MPQHETITYVEFSSQDIDATKTFFQACFGWDFTEYGEEETINYMDYFGEGFGIGFYPADKSSSTDNGGALAIFYSETLEATQAKVESSGGKIVKPIFSFPGGRRFQFTEPGGNELSVWSDKE